MYHYINFKEYSVVFEEDSRSFFLYHDAFGCVIKDFRVTAHLKDLNNVCSDYRLTDFTGMHSTLEKHLASNCLAVCFTGDNELLGNMTLRFTLDGKVVKITLDANPERMFTYSFEGTVIFGEDPEQNVYAMSRKRRNNHLRCALGPASDVYDDMLFDKQRDAAIFFEGAAQPNIRFDHVQKAYTFCVEQKGGERLGFSIGIKKNLYRDTYGIHYAPAVKRGGRVRPPVGFMTWYAVMFEASEKVVLENAAVQAEKLKDFGADTVWVDWEWYHTGFEQTEPDCDTFHPLESRYPNGLAHTAEKISRLGFVPAIWIGASHETRETDFIREHPEAVLVERRSWCGPYWFDPTAPAYLEEFIPQVFRMLTNWGYQAIKWDALPRAIDYYDMYHERFFDAAKSTEAAMRNVVKKARETVGEDIYMLSCHGEGLRDTTMYGDIFDAARIGADIFSWPEFGQNCVNRMFYLYPFHNVLQLLDPDNIVIREEFNTMEQARSRASFVSLAGTPLTFGDDLTRLPEERMEILRRVIPSMDIHTMDFENTAPEGDFVILELSIGTEWENYKVIDVCNVAQRENGYILYMQEVGLEPEAEYLLFDFWRDTFIGRIRNHVELSFLPCESRVLAIRKYTGVPQLVSTNRHVSQGGVDILQVKWEEDTLTLCGVSSVVKEDVYRLYIYIPEGFRTEDESLKACGKRLFVNSILPEDTGLREWQFHFLREETFS